MKANLSDTRRQVAFIFACGGSKCLPGKELKPLAGKMRMAHAIPSVASPARNRSTHLNVKVQNEHQQ